LIGIWTTNDALTSIDKIELVASEEKTKLILLDLSDLSFPESEMTRYFSGEKMASTFGYRFKVAGFAQKIKINRFAEDVAVNRGANFHMFFNENDAIEWLLL
jgi:hypothetical protein